MTPEEKAERARKYRREYYKKNKEKILARQKAWQHANHGKMEEYRKAYYAAHAEESKARSWAWQQANPDRLYVIRRRGYLKNRDARCAKHKEWYDAHRTKPVRVPMTEAEKKAKDAAYRLAHRERIRAYAKEYHATHKEQERAYRQAHKEARAANKREYRKAHIEEIKVKAHVRYVKNREMNMYRKANARERDKNSRIFMELGIFT